jgi:uncharacterized protein YybS (DUF2232 family)
LETVLDFLLNLFLLVVAIGLTCLASSWTLLRGFRPRTAVLTGAAVMALLASVILMLGLLGQNAGPVATLHQQFEESWKMIVQRWFVGVPKDKIGVFKTVYDKYVFMAFPAWLAISCLLAGFLAYYLSSTLLFRATARVPKPLAFREWVVPEPLVFGLIVGGLLKIFTPENSWADIAGDNLLIFFTGLYTLGGFSIVSFFLNKWRLPGFLRFVSYVVLLNLVIESICAIGVLDVWLDFRKIKKTTPEEQPS